jgi:hypothetical protein
MITVTTAVTTNLRPRSPSVHARLKMSHCTSTGQAGCPLVTYGIGFDSARTTVM